MLERGAATDVDRVPVRRNRLDSLTGIRAVGAVIVFGGHAIPALAGSRLAGLDRLLHAGIGGVSWFFVLSGFVLVWSGSTRLGAPAFYLLRAARLWPAHLTVLIVVLALALFNGDPLDPLAWFSSVLLIQSWIPDVDRYFGVNGVAWSLSCEVFFYALSPWLLPALGRLDRGARRWAMALVGMAIVAVAFAFRHSDETFASTTAWASYVFPATRLLEFVMGALLGHALLAGDVRIPRMRTALATMVGAFLLASVLPLSFAVAAVGLVPFMGLLVALTRADLAGVPTVFSHPLAIRLGDWAYAFYLVHVVVLYQVGAMVTGVGGPTTSALAVVAISFALSVLLAALLHTFIERPAERYVRRVLMARAAARPVLPVTVEAEIVEPAVSRIR